MWQLAEVRAEVVGERATRAFYQCGLADWQDLIDYSKGTRIVTDILPILEWGVGGWPILTDKCQYEGPLASSCGHRHNFKYIDYDVPGVKFN